MDFAYALEVPLGRCSLFFTGEPLEQSDKVIERIIGLTGQGPDQFSNHRQEASTLDDAQPGRSGQDESSLPAQNAPVGIVGNEQIAVQVKIIGQRSQVGGGGDPH